jgi:hypothetical protein
MNLNKTKPDNLSTETTKQDQTTATSSKSLEPATTPWIQQPQTDCKNLMGPYKIPSSHIVPFCQFPSSSNIYFSMEELCHWFSDIETGFDIRLIYLKFNG